MGMTHQESHLHITMKKKSVLSKHLVSLADVGILLSDNNLLEKKNVLDNVRMILKGF